MIDIPFKNIEPILLNNLKGHLIRELKNFKGTVEK